MNPRDTHNQEMTRKAPSLKDSNIEFNGARITAVDQCDRSRLAVQAKYRYLILRWKEPSQMKQYNPTTSRAVIDMVSYCPMKSNG